MIRVLRMAMHNVLAIVVVVVVVVAIVAREA